MPPVFTHFVAVDWSGAAASRHPGIAIAVCTAGRSAPRIVRPPGGAWSRTGVVEWLQELVRSGAAPLVAFDFSFAPPFVDRDAYFRHSLGPNTAIALWQYVDLLCPEDVDLGASRFVEHGQHRREFYLGKRDGVKAEYMRLRVCERTFNAKGGGKPSSVFDAIGAAQVCKASFSGMRVLHALRTTLPVWPFERLRPG
jgi:hypothetical protein